MAQARPYPSGNDPQGYWNVNLPADKSSTKLIGDCQKAIKRLAGEAIDAGNNDLTQNGRLPGTWNARHAETLDRPHRLCRFLDEGDEDLLAPELLQEVIEYAKKLSAETPPPRAGNIPPGFNANDYNSESPMEWCNRNMTWEEILVGWHRVGLQQDGSVWWLRPGKNPHIDKAPSATTGKAEDRDGNEAMYVFTTNGKRLEAKKSYDKFGTYTMLHHDGGFKASAAAVLKIMEQRKNERKPEESSSHTSNASSSPKADRPWPHPCEIPESLLPVPEFDLSALPGAFQAYVKDTADRRQCPPDGIAIGVMMSLATIIGGRASIRPKSKDNWVCIPNLYGVLIGRPGEKNRQTPRNASTSSSDAKRRRSTTCRSSEPSMTNWPRSTTTKRNFGTKRSSKHARKPWAMAFLLKSPLN